MQETVYALAQDLRRSLANAPDAQTQAVALADVFALLISLLPVDARDPAIDLWIAMVRRLVQGYDTSAASQPRHVH